MKKFFIVSLVSLLVGLGLGYPLFHNGANNQPVGSLKETIAKYFDAGFYAGTSQQLSVSDTGLLTTSGGITNSGAFTQTGASTLGTVTITKLNTATVGSSSSSPAAMGSAASGHFVVAAGQTTGYASTTAVTANSIINLQVEQSTPIAGTTCNATIPTSTPVVATKAVSNGFTVGVVNAPITNPLCLSYRIVN